jgi:hypothetical protein
MARRKVAKAARSALLMPGHEIYLDPSAEVRRRLLELYAGSTSSNPLGAPDLEALRARPTPGAPVRFAPVDDILWSEPDTPKRWARQFRVHVSTFKRWVKNGKILVKKLSDRSYRLDVDDLPNTRR